MFPGYFGKNAPSLYDVFLLKNRKTGKTFHLSDKISHIWFTIGSRLGILDDVLDSIMDEERQSMKCLRRVIGIWCVNAGMLPNHTEYPYSWDGFRVLLEDCDKSEAAKEYFEFLDNMP